MKDKLHQTSKKALFRYWVEKDVVLIEDEKGEVPVTIDAWNVYKYIEKDLGSLSGKKVIWRDLMGEWDGMEVENGKLNFFPIGCRSQEEAVKRVSRVKELSSSSPRSREGKS
ncbi:hypothetical protein [Telluribacter sp.]|jgi:hypothetical protein|uniref:hypothetical protein n=1 Tax=Telluribacter sp. TaxID=1978767 RepID=UPI002E123EB6|nr:hypothetical protein [Telluribacter sp.]